MKKITKKQKQNAFGIFEALAKSSITSTELRIAIVCVAAKERRFGTGRENSYANTSNERIRKNFGRKKLRGFYDDDDQLSLLKLNSDLFFNFVYRDIAGNRGVESGDGYNYRGGGYNQLTGRGNYRMMQNLTGWALVDRPSLITCPECAADVLVAFFERALNSKKVKNNKYVSENIALRRRELFLAAWINAGIGKKPESTAVTRAYKNAMEWLPTAKEVYREWNDK